jgi:hypothetical protein
MPNVAIIEAIMKLVSRDTRLESKLTPQVLDILADLALYSSLVKNNVAQSKFIVTLQKYLTNNRPLLLVPSTAINKTSALRLILSFALSKQGDDEFWS